MGVPQLEWYSLQTQKWRASQEQALAGVLLPSIREQECPVRSHPAVLGAGQSHHGGESGYVVLLLLTGLPPFMMADALVLLLGVTPALGTVSPTSCKDGSRYMATSNGLGRK